MSKLSFDALSQRADAIATEELLNSINGGTENCCHPPDCYYGPSQDDRSTAKDNTAVKTNRNVEQLK